MAKSRVLVVDDDVTIGEMLKTGLEAKGYDADIATNEQGVWASMEKNKPGIILMDVGMPGLDGISLTRNIRFSPKFRDVPIIVVTAFSDQKTYHDAMLFGADEYLTKPFEINDVCAKIENILHRTGTKEEGAK